MSQETKVWVPTDLLSEEEIAEARSRGEEKFKVDDFFGCGFAALSAEKGVDRLAQGAYHAYGARVGYQNERGEAMPEWETLPPPVRDAWRNATAAILNDSNPDGGLSLNVWGSDKPFSPQQRL